MVPLSSRVVAAAMAAVLMIDPASGADPQKKPEASNPPVTKQNIIIIAKETTRITGPLDDEGYVDYVQAINDFCSDGVTPENNYEVVVRTVMPPNEISEPLRKEYFARLGIPLPAPDARFYQDFYTFTLSAIKNEARRQEIDDEYNQIMSEPWTAAEHPHAATWVAAFETELDQLVEGSKRSKNYTPYLSGEELDEVPAPRVLVVLLGSAQQQREIARGLSIRAYGRIGAGDLDGAWSDVQAMHRVAQHVARGFTLIESLVGVAIDAIAFRAEVEILNSPHLTAAQNKRFLADLQALQPLPPTADRLDRGERYMGLDVVTVLARHASRQGLLKMLELINDLSDATGQSPFTSYVAFQDKGVIKIDPRVGLIDWNMALMEMNRWYDRLAEAAREPDFEKRKALFAAVNRDLEKLSRDLEKRAAEIKAKNPLDLIRAAGPRKSKGTVVGKILVHLLLPACTAARTAESMATARRELIQLAYAAELSRRETGKPPESLRRLVPRYVSSVPLDPLSGKPLHYRPEKDGFQLYSVGRNGIDDTQRVQGHVDDIVIRVGQKEKK